jgi:hypothetical protein
MSLDLPILRLVLRVGCRSSATMCRPTMLAWEMKNNSCTRASALLLRSVSKVMDAIWNKRYKPECSVLFFPGIQRRYRRVVLLGIIRGSRHRGAAPSANGGATTKLERVAWQHRHDMKAKHARDDASQSMSSGSMIFATHLKCVAR